MVEAVASVLIGALSIAGVAQLALRWKAYRFPELRQALGSIEEVLQGDRDFSSDRGKKAERDLEDVIEQLRAKRVRESATRALETWKASFASAPGPWLWVMGAPETDEDREHGARVRLHDENVRLCLDASRETKRRMNKLEHWTYPPLR